MVKGMPRRIHKFKKFQIWELLDTRPRQRLIDKATLQKASLEEATQVDRVEADPDSLKLVGLTNSHQF